MTPHEGFRRGFSVDACRELDRRAIEQFGMPGLVLMEHASIGAALKCLQILRNRSPARAWILCGPGNNGGDGYAVARHLHNAGVGLEVWELVDGDRLSAESDAGCNRAIARAMGIPLTRAHLELPPCDPAPLDLIVDAIFGTGLTRAPADRFADAITRINANPAPTLCIDTPSGLDADRGVPREIAAEGNWTVTFGLTKAGFSAPGASRFTGEVSCVPIGVPRELLPPGAPVFPPAPTRIPTARDPREDERESDRGSTSASNRREAGIRRVDE